ncbi:NAD-dependent epimerase [Bradyrhizobium sp. IC3069]|uniref:NAD-dependent epimerase n=1 Tax=unclassified Bradyrhizobium TaxID=2631580 RepID=UPI001CD65A39|nr:MULTISPECIES: NAD-dependent epimerase [unclassified Bradyrhizobium]MCA1365105.1 NAD-dependent epimerase [Bradyrhizobium sp. IC4059]MCA1436189.1 NAD-dependent epimerase [Bradyrhizobium sp. BRP20]MCA1522770.1 NAD-dependent epimerase [Bradyrhizobium sp. IC3069]
MPTLITGAAGFIGYHTAHRLLEAGHDVVTIDNVCDYYDVNLKRARLSRLSAFRNFHFVEANLEDCSAVSGLFSKFKPEKVIHLAAQAGVRYSLEAPHAYINSNIIGFLNILEGCRHNGVKHLVFASSSSVYGANTKMPFSVSHNVDHPLSLYAATKKSNELMAHSYAHLYNLPVSGLRFFTVYGPWGRPDMALFLFTRSIISGTPIDVFNNGKHERDFTYIDDIVEGVVRVADKIATPSAVRNYEAPDPATSSAPYRIYNIGNRNPIKLTSFIECIEAKIGRKAIKRFLPMQPGDVASTYADVDSLAEAVGFQPKTSIEEGVGKFVDWYLSYYKPDQSA